MFSRQLFLFPVLHCTTFTSQLFLNICIYFEHFTNIATGVNQQEQEDYDEKKFFLYFQKKMKIISGFKSINKKKTYFSPDFYWNCGSSFQLRPREKAILVFNTFSKNPENQYKLKFAKNRFFLKYPCYAFILCIHNISRHRRIICKTGCMLSTLLEYKNINHTYSNISLKDLSKARRFS